MAQWVECRSNMHKALDLIQSTAYTCGCKAVIPELRRWMRREDQESEALNTTEKGVPSLHLVMEVLKYPTLSAFLLPII